jgi:hypothetical protein
MTRTRLVLLTLLLAVIGLVVACDSKSGDGGATGEEAPVATTAAPQFDKPPDTTVSAGGRTVQMGIGTYCWTNMCVDKIGPITRASLMVSRGDRVVVAIPSGTTSLKDVNVTAFPAGASQDLGNGETAWQPLFDRSSELPSTRSAGAIEFAADLAAGSYVLSVGMFFDRGDVQYGVVLEVR